ncbi:MAG: hypothetical protein Kow0022_10220 [Phycisphaerales bacterium]
MRIQQKFAFLYVVIGVTAAVNLAVAIWAIRFLARELRWPLQSVQEVMLGLHQLKRDVGDLSAAIGYGRGIAGLSEPGGDFLSDPQSRTDFANAARRVRDVLDDLEAGPSYLVRSGVSTTRNLRQRVDRIDAIAQEMWEQHDEGRRAELGAELASLLELIERLDGRILSDAALAVDHESRLHTLVMGLLVFSVLGVLLAGVLGIILVRRWVIAPVERLREATLRIASGEWSHRVHIRGGDEFAELANEMNHMACMLVQMQDERVERERLAAIGEMSRRIVHNLRKPLSGIRALAETTRAELPEDSDLVGVQERIILAVDRFETWLRDILRAATPLELNPCDVEVEPWLRSVLDAHRPEAEMRGVRLEYAVSRLPLTLRFDPTHLGHALSAVISNAVDFSREGGTVRIEASSENGRWTIQVRDSGPGVPPDQAESIFRPYVTTRTTGTGIGLAIARRVAEQHGGTIRVVPPAERPDWPDGAVFEFAFSTD